MLAFVTIANKQVNTDAILGVDGALPKQTGKVKVYMDNRAGTLLSGLSAISKYTAGSTDQPAIIELVGEEAEGFRKQWQAGASMSAAG